MKEKIKKFIIDNYGDIEEVPLPKCVDDIPDRKLLTLSEMENLIEKFGNEFSKDMQVQFEMQFRKRTVDGEGKYYIDVDEWDFLDKLLTFKLSQEDTEYENRYTEYMKQFEPKEDEF